MSFEPSGPRRTLRAPGWTTSQGRRRGARCPATSKKDDALTVFLPVESFTSIRQ